MKKTLIVAFLLLCATVSYAAENVSISEKAVKTFLEVWPKYQVIAQKYGQSLESQNVALMQTTAPEFMTELNSLLAKYKMSPEEFSNLIMKITMGFASAQMQNQGLPANLFGMTQNSSLSEQELGIIRKYSSQIEKALNSR